MTATKFRYIGVTDDCVTCQNCGKDELRSTVVLAILDADGNTDEVTYYGSTCAARALGIRKTGRAILDAARAAHTRTQQLAADARQTLAYYGLPTTGPADDAAVQQAAVAYAEAHSKAQWAGGCTAADWQRMVREMISRRQSAIAEAALIGA